MKKITILCTGLVIGLAIAQITKQVLATSSLSACITPFGLIRIITGKQTCFPRETAVSLSTGDSSSGVGTTTYVTNNVYHTTGSYFTDLSNADLSQERIIYHDFTNHKLAGANLNYARLNGTDFTGDDMSGARMTDVQAIGANFTNTNLSNVIFSVDGQTFNTNLTKAIFTNATLTNVYWGDTTTCPDGTDSGDNGNTCYGHLTF